MTTTILSVSPAFRPALIQQYSLDLLGELYDGWLLEIGYVGTRASHPARQRSWNQALHASPSNPIRGVTADTVANIALRAPVPRVPASLLEIESHGEARYNGLEVSLTDLPDFWDQLI